MASNRIPWEPAVYEHKAALIDRPVEDVARDEGLLVEALQAERETYHADFLTVGIDVYNIEAEACGLKVAASSPEACPEASSPLWTLDSLPDELPLPDVRQAGRFPMMVEAGRRAVSALGQACRVRVAASGPMTLAAKLVGLENLVVAMALDEPPAGRILEFATRLAETWCAELRRNGLDVIVFDSAAAPPVTSPALYAAAVLPLHRRLLTVLERTGQRDRPLIVGGNSTPTLVHLAATGATTLLCDFAADAAAFARALPDASAVTVRRNVDPKLFFRSEMDLRSAAETLAGEVRQFAHPVAGTGILPYATDPSHVQQFRRYLEEFTRRS